MKNTAKSALFAFTTVFLWSSAFPITKFAAAAFTPNVLGLLGEVPGLMTVVGGMIIIASIVVFGLKGK